MRLRALTSLMLAVTMAAVFSLSSLAAPEPVVSPGEESLENDGGDQFTRGVIGTCVAIGEVKIDGNIVTNGATVTNGNTIASGPDGDASIELGSFGRIQLRPNTTIKLALSSNNCQIIIERCGSITHTLASGFACQVKLQHSKAVEVAVTRGEAKVKYRSGKSDADRVLKADENGTFDDPDEVTSSGESTVTINCCLGCHPPALIGRGMAGLFGVVGATTAVLTIPRKSEPPQVSLTVPQ